ncbi:MAG: metal ABC transporter substrate-binding protein [Lachnospiraceae bacterium]|nr:metal ABC transporter substrate-binding protein [Lachnospiraceae bacterium]
MKNKVQKIYMLCLSTLLCLGVCCSCGVQNADDKVTIICTSFPAYDWVCTLTDGIPSNGKLEIYWLGGGQDLHFYQPTVDDVVKIQESDLVIAVGGSLDPWVIDAMPETDGPAVIKMMDVVSDLLLEEEIVEGMEAEEEEESEEEELDEHVWLSLSGATRICAEIENTLLTLFPEDEARLEDNYANYAAELRMLASDYANVAENADLHTILVADRFPFRYLAEEMGLTYYAAFPGCSSETDASFETVIFLADKVNELELDEIFVTEGSKETIARSVLEAADRNGELLVLNAMQTISTKDGETYLSIMKNNLAVLKQALYR